MCPDALSSARRPEKRSTRVRASNGSGISKPNRRTISPSKAISVLIRSEALEICARELSRPHAKGSRSTSSGPSSIRDRDISQSPFEKKRNVSAPPSLSVPRRIPDSSRLLGFVRGTSRTRYRPVRSFTRRRFRPGRRRRRRTSAGCS